MSYSRSGNFDIELNYELDAIAQELSFLREGLPLESLSESPNKVRLGMFVYADGVNLDLGSGAGLYFYNNSAWQFIV